jgi:hypothetical protein
MTGHPIERGVELLRELILADPRLAAEFAHSRAQFFAGSEPPAQPELERRLADRRHLEWFGFERPTGAEGVPPAQVLFDAWMERADGELRLYSNSLQHSRTGVFQVTEIEPGRGLWLEDLLGHGAFPVDEPEAADQLAVDDLLAGRIYPVGESLFRLSPAVACFRNPTLLEALQRDLGQAASGRRGTLRIAQLDLEHMFFHRRGGSEAEPQEAVVTPATASAAQAAAASGHGLLELLRAGGLEAERAEAWLETLREAAQASLTLADGGASFLDRSLERLAFDTQVDLDRARALLGTHWRELREAARADAVARASGPSHATAGRAPQRPKGARAGSSPEADQDGAVRSPEQVRRALENYDRGRAAGEGLEQLFAAIEGELGLDDDEDQDAELAPDFPGVVGALLEEYRWERAHEGRPVQAAEQLLLTGLGHYTRHIGLLEELSAEHLSAFAARVAIDRGLVPDAADATRLLDELEAFARWTEEAHQLSLWSDFERRCGDLRSSLPRIARANAALGVGTLDVGDPRRTEVIEDLASQSLGVRDSVGEWRELDSPAAVLSELRGGDQVACLIDARRARPLRCYPPEARFEPGDGAERDSGASPDG